MAERAARKKERGNRKEKEKESKRTEERKRWKGWVGGGQPLDHHRLIYNAGDNRIHDQNPAFRGIDGSPCAARRRDDSGIFKWTRPFFLMMPPHTRGEAWRDGGGSQPYSPCPLLARSALSSPYPRMTSTNSAEQPAAASEMPQGFDFYMQVFVSSIDR